MVGTRGRVVAAVVAGSFVLAGGAGVASGVANGWTGATCHGGSTGFALSLVSNARGSVSPVAAAQDFVRNGATGGFGSAASRWRVAPSSHEPGAATVTDGAVFLHTVQLVNGRWAVDSGGRCS